MSIVEYLMSFVTERRNGHDRRKEMRYPTDEIDRRTITRREATCMLDRAVDNFSEVVTLTPRRTKELFRKHLK